MNRNIRMTHHLNQDELAGLKDRTKIFVAEKSWEGLDGLTLTEEMKVTIAAQASMMLLGVEDFYFDNVKTVLLFPNAFRREGSDGVSFGAQHRAGEAWQGGPIVLSWRDAIQGCRNEDDGANVVIHEFAHALDGLDGYMGGNISFEDQATRVHWEEVVDQGYEELVEAKRSGRRTLLDHYGATNKAEYFAVATETFFEKPDRLKKKHPELFGLLAKYFKVNPMRWHAEW